MRSLLILVGLGLALFGGALVLGYADEMTALHPPADAAQAPAKLAEFGGLTVVGVGMVVWGFRRRKV